MGESSKQPWSARQKLAAAAAVLVVVDLISPQHIIGDSLHTAANLASAVGSTVVQKVSGDQRPQTNTQKRPDSRQVSPATVPVQAGVVRIMSYNTLNERGGKIFGNTMSNDAKMQRVANLILSRKVAIAGIQETTPEQLELLQQKLPAYRTWPEKYSGADYAGSRPIIWDGNEYDLVPQGSGKYDIERYCDIISMPRVHLVNKHTGRDLYAYNQQASANGPESNPCTKSTRPYGKGAFNNDSGPTSRQKSIKAMIDDVNSIVPHGVPALFFCDCNDAREHRPKDGNTPDAERPYFMLQRAGFIDSFDNAEQQINPEFSSAHADLFKRSHGGKRIDHGYVKAVVARFLRSENVIGPETEGFTDHTPIISDVVIG